MRIIILFLFVLSAGLVHAQSPDKLVAYFSFDECNAKDNTGNGPAGALDGDVTCTCGIGSSGFRLDQDSNAIIIIGPSSQVFSTSDFTISFYMRPDGNQLQSSQQVIMYKQDSCKAPKSFWVRYNGKSQVISSGISQNDTLKTVVQGKLDPDPCWQYISLVRSNQTYTLYINGKMKDTRTTSARVDMTSNAPLKIGMPLCPLDLGYLGTFDELRIHSKALDEVERARYDVRADQILNADTLIYKGNSFKINMNATCAADYKWLPVQGVSDPFILDPIITPEEPTSYVIQRSYSYGCIATDTIHVNVIDPDTLDCSQLFIPTAFTPGASFQLNDLFGISNYFVMEKFISFEVFDRWGGRVFNALQPQDAWDGQFNGEPLNPGVYLYRIRYVCDGTEKVKSGTITLLK